MTDRTDHRAAVIDGMRLLADFVEQHPDLPPLIWSIHPDMPKELTGVMPMRSSTPKAAIEAWAEFLGSEIAATPRPDRTKLVVKGQAGDLKLTVVGDVYDWQVEA
jgi:hypothetical protein